MLFHQYPFGRKEHLTQLTRLAGAASDISRATGGISDAARAGTRASDLTSLRRTGGLDDLSITPPKSSYTSLPSGPQRRIAAGNEFSSRNLKPSKTSPPESLTSMQYRLDIKQDVRDTARVLGDNKKVDILSKQIDELEIEIGNAKALDDLKTPELRNAMRDWDENPASLVDELTPPGQSKLRDAADDVIADMKKPGWKNMTPEEKWQSIKDFGNKNAKLLGATALVVTLSALYIKSQIDSNRINSTGYTIKKITSSEDTITVTYEPEDKFTKNDVITIIDSNSTPKIDGDITPTFTGKGVIRFKGKKLTTPGDSGKFSVYTSVEEQFAQNVADTTKPVTQAVGQTAGTVIGSTLGGLYEGIVPSNVRDFFNEYWIISLIVCIIFCISSSISVILAYT